LIDALGWNLEVLWKGPAERVKPPFDIYADLLFFLLLFLFSQQWGEGEGEGVDWRFVWWRSY